MRHKSLKLPLHHSWIASCYQCGLLIHIYDLELWLPANLKMLVLALNATERLRKMTQMPFLKMQRLHLLWESLNMLQQDYAETDRFEKQLIHYRRMCNALTHIEQQWRMAAHDLLLTALVNEMDANEQATSI